VGRQDRREPAEGPDAWDGLGGLDALSAVVRRQLEQLMVQKSWAPLPHQVPPAGDDWLGWLMVAGRGSGKTAACSRWIVDHAAGPPCLPGPVPHWIGIIAPTLGDAATACYSGPAGIASFDRDVVMSQKVGGLLLTWPNGSVAKMFGAREPDDIERLRAGGNTCAVWCEELAAWRYMQDAWDQMRFGLRVGRHPHWIASTTPKPRPLIKKLVEERPRGVVTTTATTYDNPHLPQHIRDALEETYGGTTLGAQELYGRLIEQDEDALWTREVIEANRVAVAPPLKHVVVGVDPSGGSGEQGIVVVGQVPVVAEGRTLKHGYVLSDASVRAKPEGWGRAAVEAAVDHEADAVVVEVNFGGDMAVSTVVNAAEQLGVPIPVRTVRASRGKSPRAEPVSALSVQGRWHHVGRFDELEDQLCTWTRDSTWSPDRLDAMVWPAWYLKVVTVVFRTTGSFGGGMMGGVLRTRSDRSKEHWSRKKIA